MIHRENDAKSKVCPIMQAGSQTREPCVGSDCMMWQRSADEIETFAISQQLQKPPDPPAGDGWVLGVINNSISWVRTVAKTGYCGLIQS